MLPLHKSRPSGERDSPGRPVFPVSTRLCRTLLFLVVLAGGSLAGAGDAVPRDANLHRCMSADARSGQISSEEKTAERVFVRFFSCVTARADHDRRRCNTFTAEALQRLYHLEDLYEEDRSFVDTSELATKIKAPRSGWILLGKAESQHVLREAKRRVESGHPTIALLLNSRGEGHVALVLPGDLQRSPKWNDVLTPNSASFPHTTPAQSFIGCKLSYAFPDPKGVSVYYRPKRE